MNVSDRQASSLLAALRDVAVARGARDVTDTDRRALCAFDRYMLRRDYDTDAAALPASPPDSLAAAFDSAVDRAHVVQFLIVMAVVDGTVDASRIARVIDYAGALGVDEDAVRQLAELARGNLAWVRADAQRQNMLSITGHATDIPEDAWILPYGSGHADQALADRFRALGTLAPATFGRTFFEFYRENGFAFPGEPTGVNARFAVPHDSSHVLSGYDTTPQGELLVSTFTAGMHPKEPMSGHILPVIMSWHMGIELVRFAGSMTGNLDPAKFWAAWERGAEVSTDVFSEDWDLFTLAAEPIDDLRAKYHVPPLDAALAAHGNVPPWYHPAA